MEKAQRTKSVVHCRSCRGREEGEREKERIDERPARTGRAVSKRQKVDGKHHSDVPPKCTEEATSQPLW